jgi:hypothetical protein
VALLAAFAAGLPAAEIGPIAVEDAGREITASAEIMGCPASLT